MTGRIEHRLKALDLELALARAPVANYLGTKRSGDLLFVCGTLEQRPGSRIYHLALLFNWI